MRALATFILALGLLFATQACNKEKKPSPEESCHFQQNAYLQRVSWSKKPVVMYADASLSAAEVNSLQEAMGIWNDIFKADFGGKDIFEFGGVLPNLVEPALDGKNIVSITENWTGTADEQAETYLHWDRTNIVDADVRVNGNKNLALTDTVARNQLDTVSLLAHELGHVLGLAHIVDDDYTIMSPTLSDGTTDRRKVGQQDVDALKCEY